MPCCNDQIVESAGERYRVWDNCFNPMYTEETSGHSPRAPKSNRFRNRFGHKFWYYPDKYDSLLSSGCGRCNVGPRYVCVDGPVFTMAELAKLLDEI